MFTTAFELRSSMLVRKRHGTNDHVRGAQESVRGARENVNRRVARPACQGVPRRRQAATIRFVGATRQRARNSTQLQPDAGDILHVGSSRCSCAMPSRSSGPPWMVKCSIVDTHRRVGERDMNARCDSTALAARIYSSFPVAQPAFARLLHLLDIEATDSVPTAAVTLGARWQVPPQSQVRRRKLPRGSRSRDAGTARAASRRAGSVAVSRLTPAQNWAFDCVIDSLADCTPSRITPHSSAAYTASTRCPRRCSGPRKAGVPDGTVAVGSGGRRAPRAL